MPILDMIVGRLPDVGQLEESRRSTRLFEVSSTCRPTRCDVFRQLQGPGWEEPFPFTEPALTKEGFRVRVTIDYSGHPQIRLLSRCLFRCFRRRTEGSEAALPTKRKPFASGFAMANKEGMILIKKRFIMGKVLHEKGLKGGIAVV
jgi:hypothetical protein